MEPLASLLFVSFELAHPHDSRMFSFACQVKLSWSIYHFKFLLQQDRTEEITNLPDITIPVL